MAKAPEAELRRLDPAAVVGVRAGRFGAEALILRAPCLPVWRISRPHWRTSCSITSRRNIEMKGLLMKDLLNLKQTIRVWALLLALFIVIGLCPAKPGLYQQHADGDGTASPGQRAGL